MGLRQGEALGLLWEDVDLVKGYLHVKRRLQRFDAEFQLVDVKTARSRRTLVMPATNSSANVQLALRTRANPRTKG